MVLRILIVLLVGWVLGGMFAYGKLFTLNNMGEVVPLVSGPGGLTWVLVAVVLSALIVWQWGRGVEYAV